jgi:hypothetical protein
MGKASKAMARIGGRPVVSGLLFFACNGDNKPELKAVPANTNLAELHKNMRLDCNMAPSHRLLLIMLED